MGWKDIIKTVVQVTIGPVTTASNIPFITNPKIKVDPRLIRRIKNDPSLYENSDFIEETLNRNPGLTVETLRRMVESHP